MQSALHLSRLAMLEGAILSLLRESASDHDQHDGMEIYATRLSSGEASIEVTYLVGGIPVSGDSL